MSELRRKRVRELNGEAGLADLLGVRCSETRELGSDVIDDVKIAVWAVVVSQAKIGTDSLCGGTEGAIRTGPQLNWMN
jgi:hypothetical protein